MGIDQAAKTDGVAWIAEETGRTDPASEAWSLMHYLFVSNKRSLWAVAKEFDLAPQQALALRVLGAAPRPMRDLAETMFVDSSSITGIVDRLEERGLVRREAAAGDRRVKLLVLTEEGDRVRFEITKRFAEPLPAIASLSVKDQKALCDILRRAVESQASEAQEPPAST